MPKIQTTLVDDFFKNIKYMLEGINETVKSGDDGFQYSVNMQIEEIEKAMESFSILNLSIITPIAKTQLGYMKFREDYFERKETNQNVQTNSGENAQLFKADLYLHIKKELRGQCLDLSGINNNGLFNFIELNTIINSLKYEKLAASNEWFYQTNAVINDVVAEIIEQRSRAPQKGLFD